MVPLDFRAIVNSVSNAFPSSMLVLYIFYFFTENITSPFHTRDCINNNKTLNLSSH